MTYQKNKKLLDVELEMFISSAPFKNDISVLLSVIICIVFVPKLRSFIISFDLYTNDMEYFFCHLCPHGYKCNLVYNLIICHLTIFTFYLYKFFTVKRGTYTQGQKTINVFLTNLCPLFYLEFSSDHFGIFYLCANGPAV